MKHLAAILLAGLCAFPAQAKPRWKRIAFKAAVLAGTSVLQYKATTYCSRGNVETCNVGYGSRRAFNWFSIGMGAALIPLSEKCQNDDGPKPACYGLAYGVPAMQTTFGLHDIFSYSPKEKNDGADNASIRRNSPSNSIRRSNGQWDVLRYGGTNNHH